MVGRWFKSLFGGTAPHTGATTRAGRCRYACARVLHLPGMQIVDLRTLARDALAVGRLGVVREQLKLEPPAAAMVLVVAADVLRGWAELSDVALVIVAGHAKELLKAADARLFVYPTEPLSEQLEQRLEAFGLPVARELTNFGATGQLTMRDFLATLDAMPSAEQGEPRPVVGCTWLGAANVLGGHVAVHVDGALFIDLRRAQVPAIRSLAVLGFVAQALQEHRRVGKDDDLVVWVLAPWILEAWGDRCDEAIATMGRLAEGAGPRDRHRLVVYGEGAAPATLARVQGLGFPRLSEAMQMRTTSTTFEVPMLDVLTDVSLREGAAP